MRGNLSIYQRIKKLFRCLKLKGSNYKAVLLTEQREELRGGLVGEKPAEEKLQKARLGKGAKGGSSKAWGTCLPR